jgi:uncharacterized protein
MTNSILRIFLIFIGISFLNVPPVNSQTDSSKNSVPPSKILKYVVDETGTLFQGETEALITKLITFEKETSNQVVVFMINTLNGQDLFTYSNKLARENNIGSKGKNNGVLLLIVKQDKQLRIEVGYGLEGALPDITCSSIIRNEITPSFKKGKYYEGITKGIDAIILATKGEYKADKDDGKFLGISISNLFVIGFFAFFILINIIQSIFRRKHYSGSSKGGYWGGWGSGGFGGGSSGGSFGGFSGGGGSFGGGGASGSW